MTPPNLMSVMSEHLIASKPNQRLVNKKNHDLDKVYAVGTFLLKRNEEMLASCCKSGIVGAMNRWIPGKIEETRVARIVETIVAKNKSVRPEDALEAVLTAIDHAALAYTSRIWV